MPDEPPLLAYPDPPLTDNIVVPATFTPGEGLAWIERQWSRHDEGTGLSQAIADAASNEALGASVLMAQKPGTVEIGYWLIHRARECPPRLLPACAPEPKIGRV